ncbi:MAG TPA: hypothetical protein VNO21_25575, partial [Polyangiaceae bacterium]|nr:hypothetical protein [Polyangiaceae bacterium]
VWRRRELAHRIQRAADAGSIAPGDIAITGDLILAGLSAPLLLWQLKRASPETLHARVVSVWQRLLNPTAG